MFKRDFKFKFERSFFIGFLIYFSCIANERHNRGIPICTFTNPVNESSFTSPANVTIKVIGEDHDGNIDTLKLFSNKTIVSITTKNESTFTLNNLGTGTYIFQAIVIDNNKNYSDTAEIKFFVTTPKGFIYKEIPIIQSSDDAVESIENNRVYLNNKILSLTKDKFSDKDQVVGLRFRNINIPQKTLINHAYVKFTSAAEIDEGFVLAITGHLSGNSQTFSDTNTDITIRSSTFSSVSWNTDPWIKKNESGYIHQTPDLKEIIQELVNQDSFNKTSSITLLIRGDCSFTAGSYDKNPSYAPKLIIEYKKDSLTTGLNENKPPKALFSFIPIEGKAPLKIRYDAMLSRDPEGDSLEYLWEFGDGTVSTEVEGTHLYNDTGIYSVVLKVVDSKNALDISSIKIHVTNDNIAPRANIIVKPLVGDVPHRIKYDAINSYDPEGDSLLYYWDFDDGITSNEGKGEHNYIISKDYKLMLIVSDGELYDTAFADIVVKPKINHKPIIIFNLDTIPGRPLSCLFDASNSYDPDGDDLQYIWSFGDGFISTNKRAEHSYKKEGIYDVILTIVDENNNSTIEEKSITIKTSSF